MDHIHSSTIAETNVLFYYKETGVLGSAQDRDRGILARNPSPYYIASNQAVDSELRRHITAGRGLSGVASA